MCLTLLSPGGLADPLRCIWWHGHTCAGLLQKVEAHLQRKGLCRRIYYKEHFLPKALAGRLRSSPDVPQYPCHPNCDCLRRLLAAMTHTHTSSLTDLSGITGLHSEQKAAIDLLVLARGQRFVGLGRSSYSKYLQQLRLLR